MGSARATGSAMREVTTRIVPPRERFDYWRAQHEAVDLSLTDRTIDTGDYDAHALIGLSPDGIQFGSSVSANTRARFGRNSADRFMLAMTIEGSIGLQYDHDGAAIMSPGSGLAMIDCRRPIVATTHGRHRQVYLTLPRRLVVAAVGGGNPIRTGESMLGLDGGVVPFLTSHLRKLDDHGRDLSAADGERALQVACDLALHCITTSSEMPCDGRLPAARALYAAAGQYLQRHLGDAELTATGIAAALGCSRAHLYRVFALHEATIGDTLRDVRLGRARQLLESRPDRAIEQIAFAVGYKSPAAFSRAFRGRFGLSPRDWQRGIPKR